MSRDGRLETDVGSGADAPDAHLAEQVRALAALNDLSMRLWRASGLRDGLYEILSESMAVTGADMGNVQIFDTAQNVLRMEAHRGLPDAFVEKFREVSATDDTLCRHALRTGERVVICPGAPEVTVGPDGGPLRCVAKEEGCCAVQIVPLKSRNGAVLGLLCTQFRTRPCAGEARIHLPDGLARLAAAFIEHWHDEDELRRRERSPKPFLDPSSSEV